MMNKSLIICLLVALFAVLCATTAQAALSRENFIQSLQNHGDLAAKKPLPDDRFKPMAEEMPQPTAHSMQHMINNMSTEEFRDSLRKAGIKSRASRYENQQSVWSQIYEVFNEATTDTTPTDTTTSAVDANGNDVVVAAGDDQHTKNLKKRAVIALAVFLPLLIIAYVAFFVAIFFFIPGSNNPGANKNNSKTSGKSSTHHSDKKRKDDTKDHDSSTQGSKTQSTGGSRTKNNVSTTI